MDQRKVKQWVDRAGDFVSRRWVLIVILSWIALSAWMLFDRWANVNAFWLGDTDDNLRMSQVRALLAGQDWYDLRQYRLNSPTGADIHWSRLVDLPIAGLMLLLRPLIGGQEAERAAIAIAPLLPLLLLMFSVAVTTRRLIDPRAYPLTLITLFYAASTLGMFAPTRIDHHGWQLALLALAVAAICDPKRARGGVLLGVATALSLAVGLEMLIYLALLAGTAVLMWVADPAEKRRLALYGASVAGGTSLAFLIFSSQANRAAVCDALSPVWLSNAALGGALVLGLALLSPKSWQWRLGAALLAGAAIATFYALAWPHCLTRLEGVSPEVYDLWLSHVREARPVYRHGWRIAMLIVALPLTGVIGWAVLARRNRLDLDLLRRTLAAALPGLAATLLLLWQSRTGPAAQLLATTGSAALVWLVAPLAFGAKNSVVRTVAPVLVVVAGLGAASSFFNNIIPTEKKTERQLQIARANRACNSMSGMRAVAQQPKGNVFTFVDLGPRLITISHHNAVAGPYHRNGEQIADVMKLFRGNEQQARALLDKYRADYLLTCPMMSSATIFMAEAPKGFYVKLTKGQAPDWLQPVDLPDDSPFAMWRVMR